MRVITESGRENEGLAAAAPHRSKTSRSGALGRSQSWEKHPRLPRAQRGGKEGAKPHFPVSAHLSAGAELEQQEMQLGACFNSFPCAADRSVGRLICLSLQLMCFCRAQQNEQKSSAPLSYPSSAAPWEPQHGCGCFISLGTHGAPGWHSCCSAAWPPIAEGLP